MSLITPRNQRALTSYYPGVRAPGPMALLRGGINAVGTAVYRGMKRRKASQGGRKSGTAEPKPLSFQNDQEVLYRKGRVNKRRARRARRGYNSYIANTIRSTGLDVYRRASTTIGTSVAGNQGYFSIGLYGIMGETGTFDDVDAIRNTYVNTGRFNKLIFQNASLDITIRNDPGATESVWLDAFYVTCRKDVASVSTWNTIAKCFAYGINLQSGGSGSVGPGDIGCTPFQAQFFCENFIIRHARRLKIAPGENVSFEMRRRRNVVISTNESSTNMAFRKGISCGILFIQAGGPDSSTGNPQPTTVYCNYQKYYHVHALSERSGSYVNF